MEGCQPAHEVSVNRLRRTLDNWGFSDTANISSSSLWPMVSSLSTVTVTNSHHSHHGDHIHICFLNISKNNGLFHSGLPLQTFNLRDSLTILELLQRRKSETWLRMKLPSQLVFQQKVSRKPKQARYVFNRMKAVGKKGQQGQPRELLSVL